MENSTFRAVNTFLKIGNIAYELPRVRRVQAACTAGCLN